VKWLRAGWLLPLALLLTTPVTAAPATPVLRVGVLEGAQPCSSRVEGNWQGLAVDLWNTVAVRSDLPYVLEGRATAAELLQDTQAGQLDVAVSCLNVSPERVGTYRFAVPFQEMGLAVMVKRNRLEVGQASVRALLAPDLLQLLGGYLLAIALVSWLLCICEGHGQGNAIATQGRRRTYAKVFQILATGPGTNTIADTTRGHALVLLSYLIRIVTASLLVGAITVNVVQQPRSVGNRPIRNLGDLEGQRVAVRPGSVSEAILKSLNSRSLASPVQLIPLDSASAAPQLLLSERADAVLADDLQLQYALAASKDRRLELVLQGLMPESQAFALSPDLDEATADRINQAITQLKRTGAVQQWRQEAMNKS
jgi:ABC-type amino acid transport substrate-binding protein